MWKSFAKECPPPELSFERNRLFRLDEAGFDRYSQGKHTNQYEPHRMERKGALKIATAL